MVFAAYSKNIADIIGIDIAADIETTMSQRHGVNLTTLIHSV